MGKWNASSQVRQTQVPHSGGLVLSTGNGQNQCGQEVPKKQCAKPEKLSLLGQSPRTTNTSVKTEEMEVLATRHRRHEKHEGKPEDSGIIKAVTRECLQEETVPCVNCFWATKLNDQRVSPGTAK